MTDSNLNWQTPSQDVKLLPGEVHVWRACLKQPADQVNLLAQTLSQDEMDRAARFRFDRDQRRYILSRGVLRAILGWYLEMNPQQIRFCYGERGKPSLSDRSGNDQIQFNLAHSHELALYALLRGDEIGVDLEYIRPMKDLEKFAAGFFSPSECEQLLNLPVKERQIAFFHCWTCKEAYIKATGDGLLRALDKFQVSLHPGEPAQLLGVEEDPAEIDRWSLRAFAPYDGYIAAVAAEGHNHHYKFWQMPIEQT